MENMKYWSIVGFPSTHYKTDQNDKFPFFRCPTLKISFQNIKKSNENMPSKPSGHEKKREEFLQVVNIGKYKACISINDMSKIQNFQVYFDEKWFVNPNSQKRYWKRSNS